MAGAHLSGDDDDDDDDDIDMEATSHRRRTRMRMHTHTPPAQAHDDGQLMYAVYVERLSQLPQPDLDTLLHALEVLSRRAASPRHAQTRLRRAATLAPIFNHNNHVDDDDAHDAHDDAHDDASFICIRPQPRPISPIAHAPTRHPDRCRGVGNTRTRRMAHTASQLSHRQKIAAQRRPRRPPRRPRDLPLRRTSPQSRHRTQVSTA